MSPGAGVSLAVLAHALLLGYWAAKVDLMDFYTLIMERLVWYSHVDMYLSLLNWHLNKLSLPEIRILFHPLFTNTRSFDGGDNIIGDICIKCCILIWLEEKTDHILFVETFGHLFLFAILSNYFWISTLQFPRC